MIVQALAFYLFSAIMVASAVMVIASRNPVHSVVFLITAFFNAAGLLLLIGAEFVAMILIIVYIGAVAVLFLFVVMMLDVDFGQLRKGASQYLPLGGAVGLVLLAELLLVLGGWVVAPSAGTLALAPTPAVEQMSNTVALGHVLYTHYFYVFQASGVVLLIAMIGAIVLTLRERQGVRRQRIEGQVSRRRDEVVAVTKVRVGEGV
ncbi:MAG: NADH-quinone oxidoreductase subunit J [Azospirillaceae bacterium]|nr:NADH-quinone oxidoreductase subunit J [Azospirillaceae bacterium]